MERLTLAYLLMAALVLAAAAMAYFLWYNGRERSVRRDRRREVARWQASAQARNEADASG